MKRIKIMAIAMVLVMFFTSTSNVFAESYLEQYEETIKVNNFVITVLEKSKEYSKMLIVNTETGAEETLESFTSKDGERKFIINTETDKLFVYSNDFGIDIMDEDLNHIKSYDLSKDNNIIPMADWGPPSYFSGDRHTDVGTLSLVIS